MTGKLRNVKFWYSYFNDFNEAQSAVKNYSRPTHLKSKTCILQIAKLPKCLKSEKNVYKNL